MVGILFWEELWTVWENLWRAFYLPPPCLPLQCCLRDTFPRRGWTVGSNILEGMDYDDIAIIPSSILPS